jgi:hypothetical protein
MNAIMGKKKTVITAVSQIHRDESQIETVVAQD